MVSEKITLNGYEITCHSVNTLIIGSGTASLNAALSLVRLGQSDIAIVTEKMGGGTSANAGSDKQTYYKLSLSGDIPDSPVMMAQDLFNGKCMHGDIALCEAQGSAEAFMNLVRIGVPFPKNRYGAWVGYKTDNDPCGRATSAGPYTSSLMTKALSDEIIKEKIKTFDRYQVITLLHKGDYPGRSICGAVAIDLRQRDIKKSFTVFNSVNTVLGTGGPAGIYETSVYPDSQSGSTGIALAAGATAQNLTESQFGIASLKFRWNLSGSFQQVIPRYLSTDQNGKDEKEFLNEFFPDLKTLTHAIFLKGYQWPFDVSRLSGHGSSLIDLLVHRERVEMGRRVFLDYTGNPSGYREKFSLSGMAQEVKSYLTSSGANGSTPYERLVALNRPAIEVFRSNGIDLANERLEIAVCAQHSNGGLKGDIWWESDLRHLFPVGEVNGSHGVSRPGGAALNSGQVGSMRAAIYIAGRYKSKPPVTDNFIKNVRDQLEDTLGFAERWQSVKAKPVNKLLLAEIRKRMSENAGIVRSSEKINAAAGEAYIMLRSIVSRIRAATVKDVAEGFRVLDHCLTHYVYLEAIKEYLKKGGRSRGSSLVCDPAGTLPTDNLGNGYRFTLCDYEKNVEKGILEACYRNGKVIKNLAEVKPVPPQELWFEKVWKKNLEDNSIDC